MLRKTRDGANGFHQAQCWDPCDSSVRDGANRHPKLQRSEELVREKARGGASQHHEPQCWDELVRDMRNVASQHLLGQHRGALVRQMQGSMGWLMCPPSARPRCWGKCDNPRTMRRSKIEDLGSTPTPPNQ
eukprot:3945588-Pyramimonas_sp.AAC.1